MGMSGYVVVPPIQQRTAAFKRQALQPQHYSDSDRRRQQSGWTFLDCLRMPHMLFFTSQTASFFFTQEPPVRVSGFCNTQLCLFRYSMNSDKWSYFIDKTILYDLFR